MEEIKKYELKSTSSDDMMIGLSEDQIKQRWDKSPTKIGMTWKEFFDREVKILPHQLNGTTNMIPKKKKRKKKNKKTTTPK